jgi:alpha-beta hydrolase superfamily lysophospholipase
MKHIEGNFTGIRNLGIYYQAWLPDGDAKAVIFLVHGNGEHCGRYMNLVNRFVPQGYAVYGMDHIGHGKSEGAREMVNVFDDYHGPLNTFYNMVKDWQPGKPVFIFGHSQGGLIEVDYLLEHQADFRGAIVSAPAVKVPSSISAATIMMGKLLSAIAPSAGVVGLDITGLSHDQAVVDAYAKDPLVYHGKIPARLAAEMLKTMVKVTANFGKITLPLMVVQGSEDRLVDPAGASLLYEQAGSLHKTLKVYEGFYHEIHNEPGRESVFKDMEVWFTAHL